MKEVTSGTTSGDCMKLWQNITFANRSTLKMFGRALNTPLKRLNFEYFYLQLPMVPS